jgi:pyroglutamyl-peptidase
MKSVLVTGFEPFGGETVNPSALAAQALDGKEIAGRLTAGVVLPCIFGDALKNLRRAMRRVRPELVLCVGQSNGRAAISLERIAINLEDAPIPDNAGRQPLGRPVAGSGPAAYWSTLPLKDILAALMEEGIPAEISHSAGTFVCNHVFYGLMHALAKNTRIRGGFIHVPYLPEQARRAADGSPSMSLRETVRSLEIAINVCLTTRRERRLVAGAIY